MENHFFQILVEGAFATNQLKFRFAQPGTTMKRTPESEAYLSTEWQKLLASSFKPWPKDQEPTRFRLADARAGQKGLIITLDPCVSYRDCVGGATAEFFKKFGKDCSPYFLAASMLIVAKNSTSNDHVMLSIRNKEHDYKGGGYHASIAGALTIGKDKTPIDAAYREMHEECGLTKDLIQTFICRGIVEDKVIASPDILFIARSSISAEKILLLQHDRENKIVFLPLNANTLKQWILTYIHAATHTGIAGLMLLGKDYFGQSWYEKATRELAHRSSGDFINNKTHTTAEARDIKKLQKALRTSLKQNGIIEI